MEGLDGPFKSRKLKLELKLRRTSALQSNTTHILKSIPFFFYYYSFQFFFLLWGTQEEKAAMQMEALQYQRVMEEQVDYNQEALQKCNEIISQKEKYIEELEAELVIYREQPGNTGVAPDVSDISSLGFAEQKAYISDRLRELEERLHHFSNSSSFVESPKLDSIEEVDEENFPRENGEVSESVPVKKNHCGKKDLVELEEEILRLSKRLKALEADHNFLEHSLNSLKSGQEGARFIREIAVSLQDLRDLGIAHGK